MTKEEKSYFKQLLLGQLNDLSAKTKDKRSGQDREYLPDLVDRASEDTSRDLALRIREREYHLIRKIRQTLERIEDGTFGICEECGEEIPIPRLKARPVTTLCIACKQEQETAERMVA